MDENWDSRRSERTSQHPKQPPRASLNHYRWSEIVEGRE